uniref:non-specific serine/threonine protein kinase n=2 Tax=Rhizophora mucronata TaxID=61149 RepID=A0A2P2J915_RHIMU
MGAPRTHADIYIYIHIITHKKRKKEPNSTYYCSIFLRATETQRKSMFPDKIEPSIKQRGAAHTSADKVVVAVKAENVISKTALAWALTHVVHPGDCVTLLAVFSDDKNGKRFWNFPRFAGDCGKSQRESSPDRVCEISESCSRMVLQFHNQIEVGVRVKVVSSTTGIAVAAEAKRNEAKWVVLDKKLKKELKHCMAELRCNIVSMKGPQAKVLRLNLGCSDGIQTPYFSAASTPDKEAQKLQGHGMLKHSTPASSPEEPNTSYSRTGTGLSLSSNTVMPAFLPYKQNPLFEGLHRRKDMPIDDQNVVNDRNATLDSDKERLIPLTTNPISSVASNHKSVFWIPQNDKDDKKTLETQKGRNKYKNRFPTSRTLLDKFVQYDQDIKIGTIGLSQSYQNDYILSSSIRSPVSSGRTYSMPPPLCSLCQNKAPVFGKPPRQFSYEELQEATGGFSDMNFLARGGFGNVYKGVLRDGQVVAVKLLKSNAYGDDDDFSREVRVLSCAQHRNVVLLIGYCIDRKNRILVYEYICNGSLDFHLHENEGSCLDWQSRMKIATGTARGLRYLHEDCRVGCIVHRDMWPNNILVTHDFEPLVADFGLARWQSEWNISAPVQVIGTPGFLAPEYVDGTKITERVDVYAFGVVLLELMTGRRIGELQFHKGQHSLSDWFHPLAMLEPTHVLTSIYQLLDPCLILEQLHEFSYQIQAMARAAALCLSRNPEVRPPMSKVLRMLEGGDLAVPFGLDLNTVGNRSGHLPDVSSQTQAEIRKSHSRKFSH